MTAAGRFVLLLLTALGGVACHAESDLLRKRDGGADGTSEAPVGGASGTGGGAGLGGDATGGSGGVAGTGGAGAGGTPGPIIGMPLATFDTTLDGFVLDISVMSYVLLNGNGVQQNLASVTNPPPYAELAWDPTEGSPTPGSLKVSAPYSGICCQFVQVVSPIPGPQDWSDRVLHTRVRVASGKFAGVAQLFVIATGANHWWSTASLPADGNWHELTLDVSHPPTLSPFIDPVHIVGIGLQLHAGPNNGQATAGLVVFEIDSFSLDLPVAPPDAAAD